MDKDDRIALDAPRASGLRGGIFGRGERPFEGAWSLRARSSRDERVQLDFDASPSFACELPEGLWSVDAKADGLVTSAISIDVDIDGVAKPANVRFALVPAHSIRGRLMSADLEPLAEFPLSTRSAVDGRMRHGVTDHLGYFAIDELLDGRHALAFGDAERPAWHESVVELRGASVDVGVVDAPALVDVIIAVVDEESVALQGVAIEGRGARGGSIAGSTDERGELGMRRVPLGRYLVTASDRERGRVEGWVELESGANNRCTLRLPRASLRGR